MSPTADLAKEEENDVPGVSEDSSKPVVYNHSFYFKDDPMAIFLVENQLFRVHRHYFIGGSEIFRDMFSIPRAVATEGACDEQIPLPEVTVEEFETLLNFFYSLPQANDEGTVSLPDAQKKRETNLRLLSISHRFLFDGIFKIRLGDKYGLQTWLCSAYEELLDRLESLKEEEAHALGMSRITRFIRAKDDMHHERLRIANANCQNQSGRAAYAEMYLVSRGLTPLNYQLSPSETPVPTQTVARKYFLEA
ncbi:hypothetical protein P691DRAFT_755627 [Macrolepiota fuliginosa MF-IS2]|uniref:BTB domain-containing protein n=1 Tax=Macrolepiota fuliginosa MF-IS2 TaxID=1400762 RepID=A0A9P6C9Q6_9AGAR|nr:hypothetical protein P691DRAFT_755627 [Macrolepiota fuliginosa MF-IS2]